MMSNSPVSLTTEMNEDNVTDIAMDDIDETEQLEEHIGANEGKEYQQLSIESFMQTSNIRPHSKTHEELTLENILILHELEEHLMKQNKTAIFSLNSDPVPTSNICNKTNNPLLQKLKYTNCLQDCLAIDNAEVCYNCTKPHEGHNSDYLILCDICNYFSSHSNSMKKLQKSVGGSFAAGYNIDCIKYEIYSKGFPSEDSCKKKQWTNLKSSLISHADSAFHLNAVVFLEKDKSKEDRNFKVTHS